MHASMIISELSRRVSADALTEMFTASRSATLAENLATSFTTTATSCDIQRYRHLRFAFPVSQPQGQCLRPRPQLAVRVCVHVCMWCVCVCVVWTVGRGGAGVWETVGRSERILAPVGDGMKQRAQRTHETDKFTPNTDMQATVIGR